MAHLLQTTALLMIFLYLCEAESGTCHGDCPVAAPASALLQMRAWREAPRGHTGGAKPPGEEEEEVRPQKINMAESDKADLKKHHVASKRSMKHHQSTQQHRSLKGLSQDPWRNSRLNSDGRPVEFASEAYGGSTSGMSQDPPEMPVEEPREYIGNAHGGTVSQDPPEMPVKEAPEMPVEEPWENTYPHGSMPPEETPSSKPSKPARNSTSEGEDERSVPQTTEGLSNESIEEYSSPHGRRPRPLDGRPVRIPPAFD